MKSACIIAIVVMTILGTGCKEQLSFQSYLLSIESEGSLKQSRVIYSPLKCTVTLKPSNQIIANLMAYNHSHPESKTKIGKEQVEQIENALHMNVSYSLKNGELVIPFLGKSLNLSKERVRKYFEYESQNDFFIINSSSDTVSCKLYNFEYSHNVKPNEVFNLVFPRITESEWPIKLYLANPITGSYEPFEFEYSSIKNLPELEKLI